MYQLKLQSDPSEAQQQLTHFSMKQSRLLLVGQVNERRERKTPPEQPSYPVAIAAVATAAGEVSAEQH